MIWLSAFLSVCALRVIQYTLEWHHIGRVSQNSSRLFTPENILALMSFCSQTSFLFFSPWVFLVQVIQKNWSIAHVLNILILNLVGWGPGAFPTCYVLLKHPFHAVHCRFWSLFCGDPFLSVPSLWNKQCFPRIAHYSRTGLPVPSSPCFDWFCANIGLSSPIQD